MNETLLACVVAFLMIISGLLVMVISDVAKIKRLLIVRRNNFRTNQNNNNTSNNKNNISDP